MDFLSHALRVEIVSALFMADYGRLWHMISHETGNDPHFGFNLKQVHKYRPTILFNILDSDLRSRNGSSMLAIKVMRYHFNEIWRIAVIVKGPTYIYKS